MKIKQVTIKNFRGIESIENVQLENLSLFIGENGLSKTSVLEAINFALSPSFLSDRLEHRDFHNGTDESIEIRIDFDTEFKALLPDGFAKQEVMCNGIFLKAKKRDRAKSGKAFSDLVVVEHYVVPNSPRTTASGWVQQRKNSSDFKFDYRLLTFPLETEGLPRSFYFNRNRDKQIKKGFKTTIESVLNDFNWRFSKAVRKSEPPSTIPAEKRQLEEKIIGTIDSKVIESTFSAVNKKLDGFGLPNVGISIFDGSAPFDSSFLSLSIDDLELPTNALGSGVEMVISIVFLETLATMSKESIIILVDEPELHLHPSLQLILADYFHHLSCDNQVILSSHSSYIYKVLTSSPATEFLLCSRDQTGKVLVTNTALAFDLFPWSPSWSEINFYAFNIPSVELHNELYGHLQSRSQAYVTTAFETYLSGKGFPANKSWIQERQGVPQTAVNCTLPTFIRHSIHHPENKLNLAYSEIELKNSIEQMIHLVRNP